MNPADEVIYKSFLGAPYDWFQSQLAVLYAARECGVTPERVADAIHAHNPDLPPGAFRAMTLVGSELAAEAEVKG